MTEKILGLLLAALLLLPTVSSCKSEAPFTVSAAPPSVGSQLETISIASESAESPVMIQRQSGQYVLTYQVSKPQGKHIYIRVSADGQKWGEPTQVTHHVLSSAHPQLLEDESGILHLFYASNTTENWTLYRTDSRDGIQWSTPELLGLPHEQVTQPSVIYEKGRYTLAYQALWEGLFLSESIDGKKWSTPVLISETGEHPFLLKIDQNHYAVVFEDADERGWNIHMSLSQHLKKWTPSRQLTHFKRARWGRMFKQGTDFLLMFSAETEQSSWEIFVSRAPSMEQWKEAQQVTNNGMSNLSPYLLPLDSQHAFLVWGLLNLKTLNQSLVMSRFDL